MNIILTSTEVSPFAKAGGLADVTSYLPFEWKKLGHNPIVVLPKYGSIDVDKYNIKPTFLTLNVPMGYYTEFAHLWQGFLPDSEVPVYFVEHEEYFNRDGIYGNPYEFDDNDRRFIFLSRAVFEVAKAIDFYPNIIHSHDHHTAFSLAFLKAFYSHEERFAKTAGVYTIHNLAYQGKYNPYRAMDFSGFGMKEFYEGSWFEHEGMVNCMKVGIMFADKITTVSPSYSKEIRMPYYSEGLQDILNIRGGDLIGILNGVFYNEWSPENDKYIFDTYSKDNLNGKEFNKRHLLKSFGLNDEDNLQIPLVGIVSRLTEQKGINLIQDKIESFLEKNKLRFILLGSGESHYIEYFGYLKNKYPKSAFINIGYNHELSHKIIASSDFLLVPSRFEPCGLTQMYALKYGTIPIVRATGGLIDTVTEYQPETQEGTGYVFLHYSSDDFAYALHRALSIYNSGHWDSIRQNAMQKDFSSSLSATKYIETFKWALEKVKH